MASVKNVISITFRSFSTTSCHCSKSSRAQIDGRFPVTGKHVNEKKRTLWSTKKGKVYKHFGSKIMQEKLALHVVQPTGYIDKRNFLFRNKKEMIPEFIVPDLTGFQLKPYVPYNAPPIKETVKVTPQYLFEKCYAEKLTQEYEKGHVTKDMKVPDMENLKSLKSD